MRVCSVLAVAAAAALMGACNPTVRIKPPDKPIVINLNVRIQQDVRIKLDREVEDLLRTQPDIF
jgi:hypothetical protein